MPTYKTKVVKSGNHIEVYKYQKQMYRGYFKKKKKEVSIFIDGQMNIDFSEKPQIIDRRIDNLSRTRKNIKRLINSNPDMNKFITLTFAENLKDINKSNYEFKKFIQRLKFKYGDFKYLAVIEFQKRGAVHYHLVNSLPFIANSKLSTIWGNGFVKINKLKNCNNIGAYLSKYLGKETNELLYKKKKFFYSKNTLEKPLEIIDKNAIDILFDCYNIKLDKNLSKTKPKFFTRFYSDFCGIVDYFYFKVCPI